MVDFIAFKGWRPSAEKAAEVADVPYDVVNTAEAKARVAGRASSILRVTRPDVDLPDGASLYGEQAYREAQRSFNKLVSAGILTQDQNPGYYIYAQQMGNHRQVGIMGLASAEDYWEDRIKKHEFTRPQKEDDRMRHIEAVGAHLGPIFLTYRSHQGIESLLHELVSDEPDVDFEADDGVIHQLWPVFGEESVQKLRVLFREVPALYIADGHHRAAAASRIGRGAQPGDPRGLFLAVVFPDTQLKILPYNRVVTDLNGLKPAELLDALESQFRVTKVADAQWPKSPRAFTMFLNGCWYLLETLADVNAELDPVAGLDVSILQNQILAPLLGISDPRTDQRIEFVGGIRGLDFLTRKASESEGVAFALYATSLAELMAIADSGEVMPPKSTWFEPKLRTGMVVSRFK